MKQEEKQYCFGCGAELQSERPSESGYVPKEVLDSKKLLCVKDVFAYKTMEKKRIFSSFSRFPLHFSER